MKKFYLYLIVLILTSSIAKSQSVFTVTTFVDNSGSPPAGSLREAINLANSTPNVGGIPDTIKFNMGGGGLQIIVVDVNPLPTITEAVVIDGYSQGFSVQGTVGGGTRVINVGIDGSSVVNPNDGLTVNSGGVTIEGLAIYNFNGNGITLLNGAGNDNLFVWGCNIGLTTAGSIPGAPWNGNIGNGILIQGGGNVHSQIHIGSNLDGANDANEGNVLSSNSPANQTLSGFDGVQFNNTISSNVSGNFVGVDGTGNGAAKNGRNGIIFVNCLPASNAQRNIVGTNGDNVNDATETNVVSNNGGGISLLNSSFTYIMGNIIGLSVSGGAAGNGPVNNQLGSGILMWESSNNVVGVAGDGAPGAANEKNYISSNAFNGINFYVDGSFSSGPSNNKVSGNFIGVGLNGTSPIGNGNYGIGIISSSSESVTGNIIGSDDDGTVDALEANVIANNGKDGIGFFTLGSGPITGNRISRNSIHDNGGVGINLDVSGHPTCILPNVCAPTAGNEPNQFFPHPVLNAVTLSGSTATFTGWSTPGATIQFYISDASNYIPCTETLPFEEGLTYLATAVEGSGGDTDPAATGYTAVQEGAGATCAGASNFSFAISGASLAADPTGKNIVAIALSPGGGAPVGTTSQFSAAVTALGALPVTLLNFDAVGAQGKVNVSWSTATETNSDYFDVERSADGVHYSTVGTVNAKGNSTSVNKYSLVDGNPINGVSYYRLKQVDIDGRFTYSKVVIIRSNGASAKVLISPNPARTHATITLSLDQAQSLQVRVFDNTGRATRSYRFSGAAGVNKFDLNDIGNLPSGVYNVEIIGTSTHVRERFVKN